MIINYWQINHQWCDKTASHDSKLSLAYPHDLFGIDHFLANNNDQDFVDYF